MSAADVALAIVVVGLAAYAVLGGADFGGAFWFLIGSRGRSQAVRDHTYAAMGPVWEANHVWLIFVLVVFWTCFPQAFASIFSTLTVPLFLAGIGIVLRGVAYALHAGTTFDEGRRTVDGVFALSSVATPFALGAAVGAIASGRVPAGNAAGDPFASWLNATSVYAGVLAVLASAYLAAVYLSGDAARGDDQALVRAFRRRALASGTVAGAVALAGLPLVRADAPALWEGLTTWPAVAAVGGSVVAGVIALALVSRRSFELARYAAAAAVAAVVVGWGAAQPPELVQGLSAEATAAGRETLVATILGVALGAAVLVPSLFLLFRLVLRGTFDPTSSEPASARPRRRFTRSARPGLLVLLGVLGVGLTVGPASPLLRAVGVTALLASAWQAVLALGVAAVPAADAPEADEPPA